MMLFNKGYGFKQHSIEERIDFIKSMLDYPSLYLKKDIKHITAVKIANDIDNSSKYNC